MLAERHMLLQGIWDKSMACIQAGMLCHVDAVCWTLAALHAIRHCC